MYDTVCMYCTHTPANVCTKHEESVGHGMLETCCIGLLTQANISRCSIFSAGLTSTVYETCQAVSNFLKVEKNARKTDVLCCTLCLSMGHVATEELPMLTEHMTATADKRPCT